MRDNLNWLGSALMRLLARPDELMLEVGGGGELLLARVRALLSPLLLVLPLTMALGGVPLPRLAWTLGLALLANLMAQVWLALARDRRRHRWLPVASSAWDVSAVSLALLVVAMRDPVAALNNVPVWGIYMLAIAMTALRNDGRLTLFAGALAVLQYAAVVALLPTWMPTGPLPAADHAVIDTSVQVQRLLLLVTMTALTGVIVHRMQTLIELSGRDGLTGLPNRSWLLQRLPREFDRLRRDGGSLSIALLDLDHFKRLNEDLGHRSGDRAIRRVAAQLQDLLREDEHLVRLTGQEFVLLLRDPIGSAWERIDRARRELHARPFQGEAVLGEDSRLGESFRLTFSAGLASWPADGNTAAALLGCADQRLQSAKADGRNRVYLREGRGA